MNKASIKQKELTKRLSPPKYGTKFGSYTLTDGFNLDSSLASVKGNEFSRLEAMRNSRFAKRNKSVMPNAKVGWAGQPPKAFDENARRNLDVSESIFLVQ